MPTPYVLGATGEDCTEKVVTLGSSGPPPHTASWKDRITCWVFGLPCAGRSAYVSQFGGMLGNPNRGGFSSPATEV